MSAITRQLVRKLQRTVPLPTLKQGGTLSFRSKIPNVAVRILPEWRDDGQASFLQNNLGSDGKSEAAMLVTEEDDKMTSLGRSESHVSIRLEPSKSEEATTVESVLAQSGSGNSAAEASSDPIDFQDGDTQVTAWRLSSSDTDGAEAQGDDAVTLTVPEKVNLVCELELGGSIEVGGKIEGDVRLMTTDGDIRVKKLRGHTVDLEINHPTSTIYASDLLEAYKLKLNLHHGGRLRAKRIHGDTVDIRVAAPSQDNNNSMQHGTSQEALDEDDEGSLVDVSSMYVSGAGGAQVTLAAGLRPEKRAVRIKSHHGPVLVDVDGVHKPTLKNMTPTKDSDTNSTSEGRLYPLVELGSVNGSCEVSIRNIPDNDDSATDEEGWIACQVHYDSISPESVSLMHSDAGDIALTFDRKMEADLRLLSSKDPATLEDTAGLLADEDDPDQVKGALLQLEEEAPESVPNQNNISRITITTKSYTESVRYISLNHVVEYVEGSVENKSHEPDSRFEMKTRGGAEIHSSSGAGKIRQDGAANQALQRFSSPENSGDGDGTTARPLIVAATSGSISVESLSWLGAIARRYGLDESGKTLGRQATRRGRSVLPADE